MALVGRLADTEEVVLGLATRAVAVGRRSVGGHRLACAGQSPWLDNRGTPPVVGLVEHLDTVIFGGA